ncbi:Uncharacterised protein [Raoultella planticola]|uniref:Uncharacterized protein n=1 Tax=Raoultella planticola TaxID=575 RepID=A0A485B9R1_RAOPL|nr:Uncharacterised protein [Raoultella planticola]
MPWYMMAVWYANQHSGLLALLGLLAKRSSAWRLPPCLNAMHASV